MAHRDSQDGPGDDDDDGSDAVAVCDVVPTQHEPERLGQSLPSDTLDRLLDDDMKELEKNLPGVPLPGPSEPQIPSPPRAPASEKEGQKPPGIDKAVDGAGSSRVLPTPCRAGSNMNHGMEATKGSKPSLWDKAGLQN